MFNLVWLDSNGLYKRYFDTEQERSACIEAIKQSNAKIGAEDENYVLSMKCEDAVPSNFVKQGLKRENALQAFFANKK